ncbi:zinc-binding dehydrogenase [Candidatus Poribacteria bacterium]|nr:zinc-binding dehydrogenase [Candidatus Poribacteria bacterium]
MNGVVFLGNHRCAVREFTIPEPGNSEVRIALKASGICGSDLHVYRSAQPGSNIQGHESCGIVEKLGTNVTKLKVGDRVTVHHHQGCGQCYDCALGDFVHCPEDKVISGSFGDYVVANERNCVPLPGNVSFTNGAFFACVGGTAYAALRRLDVVAYLPQTIAVYGLGPVGLSVVLVGKAMGARVIGVDVIEERIPIAQKCGADAVVNATKENPVEAVMAFSRSGGVDFVVETSGSTGGRSNIIPLLRRGGKAAIVGVGSNEKIINPGDFHTRRITIMGSVVFPLGWMWDLVRYCAEGKLTFEPAVTHRFKIADAVEALRVADESKCGKVVFVWD